MRETADIIIREASNKDLENISVCHINSFPKQFQTCMGSKWLKAFYKVYIIDKESIVLVADKSGIGIIGFIIGGPTRIYSEFMRRALYRYWYLLMFGFIRSRIVRKTLIAELVKES